MKNFLIGLIALLIIGMGGFIFYFLNQDRALTILVTQPERGKTFRTGEIIQIAWNVINIDYIDEYDKEVLGNTKIALFLAAGDSSPLDKTLYDINSEIDFKKDGVYSWQIPSTIKPGTYKARINIYGGGEGLAIHGSKLWGLAYQGEEFNIEI